MWGWGSDFVRVDSVCFDNVRFEMSVSYPNSITLAGDKLTSVALRGGVPIRNTLGE